MLNLDHVCNWTNQKDLSILVEGLWGEKRGLGEERGDEVEERGK